MTIHLVCRDCIAESLIEDDDLAHDLADGHADRHGHTVATAKVDK